MSVSNANICDIVDTASAMLQSAAMYTLSLSHSTLITDHIQQDHLVPHAQTLLLYATSAQTHIFPEIRLDAIKFLDLLLHVVPEHVVAGCLDQSSIRRMNGVASSSKGISRSHGGKVLDGYLSLLSTGLGNGSSGNGG